MATNLLRDLFNALPDSQTGDQDVSRVYVQRAADDAHDPVITLREYIQWRPQSEGAYLFSGLRGAGKTTELNRLLTTLRADGIAAYYCDASAYLNLSEPQLTQAELLLTALAGLADAVRQAHGEDVLKSSIWDRTKAVMGSEVEIKPVFKYGGIEATLQENPDFKHKLVQFAQQSSAFYDAAASFAEEVGAVVRQKTGQDKIVLVVDSLERLSAPPGQEQALFDSLTEVFYNYPARLQLPGLVLIYTVPPYLSAVLPNVEAGFTAALALPNFKVMQRPAPGVVDCQPNPAGIAQLVAIVAQRFPQWPAILAQPVLEHLAWMSGGNVRRFFDLLRNTAMQAALGRADLPLTAIDAAPINQALAKAAEPLQWLNKLDRVWLQRFMESRNPAASIEKLSTDLPPIMRLYDHSLVLNYQNGESWHQVPPLVRRHVV